MTSLEKKVCNKLQQGISICSRPFEKMAHELNTTEETVLEVIGKLKADGIIRRFGPVIDYDQLGTCASLVTAHIEPADIDKVAGAVNSSSGVSHNYLRDHYYNMWFTLRESSAEKIEQTLGELSGRFDTAFCNMPAVNIFKLNACFDTDKGCVMGQTVMPSVKGPAGLDEEEKKILSTLQSGLQLAISPFADLDSGYSEQDILRITGQLINKYVIKRVAAVLDHRKLGLLANVLFVCSVEENRVLRTGQLLAGLDCVSHCYQRRTFPGWDYNLFAMIHARDMSVIESAADQFVSGSQIKNYQFLPTVRELKKTTVKFDCK